MDRARGAQQVGSLTRARLMAYVLPRHRTAGLETLVRATKAGSRCRKGPSSLNLVSYTCGRVSGQTAEDSVRVHRLGYASSYKKARDGNARKSPFQN
jgi:hypothetical protein